MLSLLDQITLIHLRLCKNRTALHFALKAATNEHLPADQCGPINRTFTSTVAAIHDLDTLLDFLGRPGAPLGPP